MLPLRLERLQSQVARGHDPGHVIVTAIVIARHPGAPRRGVALVRDPAAEIAVTSVGDDRTLSDASSDGTDAVSRHGCMYPEALLR